MPYSVFEVHQEAEMQGKEAIIQKQSRTWEKESIQGRLNYALYEEEAVRWVGGLERAYKVYSCDNNKCE